MTAGAARRQFARYLLAGAANTLVTYAVLLVAMRWMDYRLAYTGAYVLGIALAYVLQARFVFRVPLAWRAAIGFPAVYLVQYLAGLALLWILVDRLHLAAKWAALATIAAGVPLGFALSRTWLARVPRRPAVPS
jgi:putative flippase GtrA